MPGDRSLKIGKKSNTRWFYRDFFIRDRTLFTPGRTITANTPKNTDIGNPQVLG